MAYPEIPDLHNPCTQVSGTNAVHFHQPAYNFSFSLSPTIRSCLYHFSSSIDLCILSSMYNIPIMRHINPSIIFRPRVFFFHMISNSHFLRCHISISDDGTDLICSQYLKSILSTSSRSFDSITIMPMTFKTRKYFFI